MAIEQREIPYKTIALIAVLTVPLFGIFGGMPLPVLFSGRFTWAEVGHGVLAITVTTLALWALNTALLWVFTKPVQQGYNWFRVILSVIFFGLIGFFLMHSLRMHRPPSHFPMPPRTFRGRPGPGFSPGFRGERNRSGFLFFTLLHVQAANAIILILLDIIVLRTKKARTEKENDLLRMANLEARHNLLKQQLQPHFLFNSLTVVKALIKKEPGTADVYIDKLSELLRYSVHSVNQFTVPVAEEVRHVISYIEMQNLRFGGALHFSVEIPPAMMNNTLPVYSIQLLVENALKHNLFAASQPLLIKVVGDISGSTISVENNLQLKTDSSAGAGVGLQNLSERYKLLGSDPVRIERTTNTFSVTIKVLENESSDH